MSVLIKGMEKPKDCPMCPLAHWDVAGTFTGCNIVCGKKYAMSDREYANRDTRPDWCPLVPVPPHGRLIDADELLMHRFVGVVEEAEKSSYMVGWNSAIEAVVENAHTVIDGEKKSDG